MSEGKRQYERLPTDVVPVNYKVELQPDLTTFSFEGRMEITVKIVKATSKVVLNCADIEISSVQLAEGETASVSYNKSAETVCLEFRSELGVGDAVIFINYSGTLNDKMRGFYRTKYTIDGEERYAAITQFEAAEARRALPCWDEPAHKATYDVVLVVPKDKVALSNMNEIGCEEIKGGLKRVTFARTPVMSSYLLAFVVGEFDFVEEHDSNGVLVRVYTLVGKSNLGRFALDLAVKTLPFYADYFGVAYPLTKMDLIAIPDTAAGAMENWGLVIFRERRLLVDPDSSSAAFKQLVSIVVSHELAHQWFGNLVTMEWWTHLWLNEGFATWIEYLCVDHIHPEYEIWTNFLFREYTNAMKLDALVNSHPIEVPVGAPSEAEEVADTISYSKGSCVIRMLHDWIGTKDFRQGLCNYLKKFSYKNTSTEDLWAQFAEASNKPVAEVMSTWTQQMGYPMISVEGKQEGDKRILTISQKKFCADGKTAGFESVIWQVPVTIATKSNPSAVKFILSKASDTVTIEGVKPEDWILLNPYRQGFFCVSYSTDLFSSLLPALRDGLLSPQDRLGLLNDSFALAQAGVWSTEKVLQLLIFYKNETSYTVWESLVGNLSILDRLLSYTDCYKDFRKFAAKLFAPTALRLGWDPKKTESTLDTMLRSLVIGQLCHYGNSDTIKEAQKRFDDYCSGVSSLPADLKVTVFSTCLANGNNSTYDQFVKLHDATGVIEERVMIYRSLGKGKTEELISRCLEFSLSDKVRPGDGWYLMFSASHASPKARDMVWQFTKNKWEVFKHRYRGQFQMPQIIDIATAGFVSEEKAAEIEQFFKDNPWHMADRVVKQNCEAIRLNAGWLNRDVKAVKQWLAEQ